MTKFALYYAVKRSDRSQEVIGFGSASELTSLKAKAKEDMYKAEFGNKYERVVLASDYGIENSYKVPFQELPKKRSTRKKASEE